MSILGSVIKTAVTLNQKLSIDRHTPRDKQIGQLRELVKKASGTAFGKFYGFSVLQEASDDDLESAFKSSVPVHDYEKMEKDWWEQQRKLPDITWPGQPGFYALSSGTTGPSSKRIPITDAFVQSMRAVGMELVKEIPNYDMPKSLFESELLMLSSSADLQEKDLHLEGEISGINVYNFPSWYDWFYRPGKEIASIDDWDERIGKIVEQAPGWNVGAIAGIPSWMLVMLKEIIKYHKLDTIHDIWPNLSVYVSGGVAYDTYRKSFDDLCEEPLIVLDTYLASEGFFAYSAKPGTLDMRLALDCGYYYEFIPFDSRGVDDQGNLLENPVSLTLAEVSLDEEYILLVSTCAGAWRYMIGDTIKFTSLDPYEIRITGRTKFYLNVTGSQLSEEKMDKAIIEVSNELGVAVNEYGVAALQDAEGEYYHQWMVVSDDPIDAKIFCDKLDASLKDMNKNYRVARTKALKGVEVMVLDKATYHAYLKSLKKKGGQVKIPKVMSAEKMEGLKQLLNGLVA